MRVFVTGGTGLVGSRLVKKLLERGDKVVVLTRRYAHARQALGTAVELVEGDPMQAGDWMSAVDDCDGVVHLAGESVFAKRWSPAFKQLLVDSRVIGTRNVAQALGRKPRRTNDAQKVLVNASAIGIYGPHGDEEVDEGTPPGNDFLARLCFDWEKEAREPERFGVRCCQVRVGMVLDKGGALAQMLTPFKLFVGGPIGTGKQYISWIHHEDMVGLLLLALDNVEATGPLNGTAPNPVTNKEFSTALGHALYRPSFMWTPAFAIKMLLGETAEVIVNGQRVVPKKALALGYAFKYPTVEAALRNIVGA